VTLGSVTATVGGGAVGWDAGDRARATGRPRPDDALGYVRVSHRQASRQTALRRPPRTSVDGLGIHVTVRATDPSVWTAARPWGGQRRTAVSAPRCGGWPAGLEVLPHGRSTGRGSRRAPPPRWQCRAPGLLMGHVCRPARRGCGYFWVISGVQERGPGHDIPPFLHESAGERAQRCLGTSSR